jgi:hypothetical protein
MEANRTKIPDFLFFLFIIQAPDFIRSNDTGNRSIFAGRPGRNFLYCQNLFNPFHNQDDDERPADHSENDLQARTIKENSLFRCHK